MAINYELLNKGGISLGTNFELLSEKPLDSRLVVPSLDGLQNYIDNAAAYEGMIAYVSSEKKHYEVKIIDGVLSYRPFGLTEAELNDLITNATTAAMEFKGATATLPENPAKGDMYKVAGENINIKIDDVDAKLGDSIVYDGEKWFLIPSGDDIEDTWRPVTGVDNNATLTFAAGDKLDVAVAADGTVTYSHETVAAPELLAENEQTRTYITAVETDGHGHITGYKTATENVVDTNTEYTFESQVESSNVYFNVTPDVEGATEQTIYVDAYSKNEADGKFVAKETGKSLISDDEIARLAEVDNYDDEEVRGLIGDNAKDIEDLEKYVGTIPSTYTETNVIDYVNKKAQETLAAASGNSTETAASVKQQLDDYIGSNNTRVKAAEDAINAINNTDTGILKQAKDYADGLAGNYDEAGAAAGVQTALEAEIAKKVAKTDYEADKATFATKTEIEKLAGVSEGANKVEASETNGNIKIDGVETVVYTHKEKHSISEVDGLQDALDGKQAAGDYSVEGHKHVKADITDFAHTHVASEITDLDSTIKGYDYATKDEAKGYADAKDEAIAAALKAGTDAQADVDTLETYVGAIPTDEKYANITNVISYVNKKAEETLAAAQGGSSETAASVKQQLDNYKSENDTRVKAAEDAIALKADKSVVDAMYTNDQIDGFIAEVKKYADDNDTDTKYGIVYDSENKKIKLVEGGTDVEIDASAFIKDGMISNVEIDANDDLIITFNTDAGKENIVLPLDQLVDIYTGVEGTRVKVVVNADKSIGADLVAGSIGKDYLDENVKASLAKADSALQEHQNISHLATTEALNGVDGKFANYTTTTDLNAALDLKADKTQVATDIATAKSGAEAEAARLDAALKTELQKEIDDDVKALADTVYTKTEVEALLTWGTF